MKRKDAPGENRRLYDRSLEDSRELTDPEGVDVNPANMSGEGLRADPYGEDVSGIPPLEEEPHADDILPDQVRRMSSAPQTDDAELTARPKEDLSPVRADELPEG